MPEACLENNQLKQETRIADFSAISCEKQRNNCNRSNSIDVGYIPLVNRQYALPTKSNVSLQHCNQTEQIFSASSSTDSCATLSDQKRFCCCTCKNSENSCWRLKRRQIIWQSAHASAENRRSEAIALKTTKTRAKTTKANLPPTTPPKSIVRGSDTILNTRNCEKYYSNIAQHVNKISTSLPTTPNLSHLRRQYQKLDSKNDFNIKDWQTERTERPQYCKQSSIKSNQQLPMSTSKLRAPTKFGVSNKNPEKINVKQQMIIKRGMVSSTIDAADNNNQKIQQIRSIENARVDQEKEQNNAIPTKISTSTISSKSIQTQTDFTMLQENSCDRRATFQEIISSSTSSKLTTAKREREKSKSSQPMLAAFCERCCEGAGSMSTLGCNSMQSGKHSHHRNAEDGKHGNVGVAGNNENENGNSNGNDEEDAYSGRYYRPSVESVSDDLLSYRFVSDEEDLTAQRESNEKQTLKSPRPPTPPQRHALSSKTQIDLSSHTKTKTKFSPSASLAPFNARSTTSTSLSSSHSLSSSTRISPTICCYTTEKSQPASAPANASASNSVHYSAKAIVHHKVTSPPSSASLLPPPPTSWSSSLSSSPIDIPKNVKKPDFIAPEASDFTSGEAVALRFANSVPDNLLSSSLPSLYVQSSSNYLTDVSNPLKRRLVPPSPTPPPVPPKPKNTNNVQPEVEKDWRLESLNSEENRILATSVPITLTRNNYDPSSFRRKIQKYENERAIRVPYSRTNRTQYATEVPQHFDFNSTPQNHVPSKSPEHCEILSCFGKTKAGTELKDTYESVKNQREESLSDARSIRTNGFVSTNNIANKENHQKNFSHLESEVNFNKNLTNEEKTLPATKVNNSTNNSFIRPHTLRYDSHGRLKSHLPTPLSANQHYQEYPKQQQQHHFGGCAREAGVKSFTSDSSSQFSNDSVIAVLKSEPLPTRICVANSSAVNRLTPTLCRKFHETETSDNKVSATSASNQNLNPATTTKSTSECVIETGKDIKVANTPKLNKIIKSTGNEETSSTDVNDDFDLLKIFKSFSDEYILSKNPPIVQYNNSNKNNNRQTNNQNFVNNRNEDTRNPINSYNQQYFALSYSPLNQSSISPTSPTAFVTPTSPLTPTSSPVGQLISPFLINKSNLPQNFIVTSQNPIWLSSETIASRSSDPSNRGCDDQQSNCSDQTTIFHLDNDCSTSVTSSSSIPSSHSLLGCNVSGANKIQQLVRGPLILKRIPTIQSFGYIPTQSHSLGSGANVRENGEKEVNMEKRRNTLERFQRLGFGRKSSPASSQQQQQQSQQQQQQQQQHESSASPLTRNRKSNEKSEKLRELTELLRGNRSSPTPPPIPPPRKPRNGTHSSSHSFERSDDGSTTLAANTHVDSSTASLSSAAADLFTNTPSGSSLSHQQMSGGEKLSMEQEEYVVDRPSTPLIAIPSDMTDQRSSSPRSSMAASSVARTSPSKPAISVPATTTRFYDTLRPNASLSSFESLIQMMSGREKSKSPPPIREVDEELFAADSSNLDTKLSRPETRTATGSYSPKGIPFRSASFSQIDSASGKFKKSALSVLRDRLRRDKAVDSTSPTNSVIGVANHEKTHEGYDVAKPKIEPDWIYIPLKRSELGVVLNYGQDKSLEEVLESPDIIPEEDIFSTDVEQASSTFELRPTVTTSTVVASHAKMESLTDTIQSENDYALDDEQLPVTVELGNLKAVESPNLATLVEEQIPLESPPDNFLQTATTCLIPVPVYECAAQEWGLENPPQEWVEVAPEEFGIVPETIQPLITLDHCEVSEASTGKATTEILYEKVPTISVSRSSEDVDESSILRRKEQLPQTIVQVERRQESLDKTDLKKRYSHDDMEIDTDKQRNGSFDAIATRHSTDERKRIDKSTRRKGMYIDNADWSHSPDGIPHGKGLALDISLATFNSIKPEDSPEECRLMYLNSPPTGDETRTPGSLYSFDLSTPDSESSKAPVWSKAPPLSSFSCQSSEEKDDNQSGNESTATVAKSRTSVLTRHNKSYPLLQADSISDNESDRTPPSSIRDRTSPSPALSDNDFKRYSKRPLRGPYGQMLEAEMKKPNKMHFEEILEDLRGESENATQSRRQRAATATASSTAGLHDDAGSGGSSVSNSSRNIPQYSNSMRVRKTSTYLPVPAHTRAASTPSQMENTSGSGNSSNSNAKSGGGSVDKINPHDKRYQSSFDNSSTKKLRDKDEKGNPGESELEHTQSQTHTNENTNETTNTSNHQQHSHYQREMKRAASEAPLTKTHHSKRTQSMSGAEKSTMKLQQQQMQKHNLDVNSKANKTAASAAVIKPSQELLAELLQGSSEKLISEQRKQMFADTRTHVVQEIFRNEQSYVEALQTIVNKYFKVLKLPEHAVMIDARTVDEIFFMVPDILEIHERFLGELKSRLDNWDTQQKVGDIFMDTFSKTEVLEVYTSFVNNCNRAKNSIRTAKHQRPSFSKFLETTAREHKGKLTLDYLLIKPVQKFPNFELLFQRLQKHTDADHPDQKHLQDVLKLVRDILLHINCKEREILENGQREATLRELEGIIEGITDLIATDRQFLLFDLVSMPSGQGARKERGFFLFNDLLVLTSIKKRSGTIRKPNTSTCPGTVASTLDTNKYKFLTKISLDCLEIIKTKDENLKRIIKEIDNLASDCNKLQQITDITISLRCPHQFLEDAVRELHRDIQRQLSERQTNDAQLNMLELSVNSPNGSQKLSIVFSKAEKRTQWEQTFNDAKQKLAATLERHPIPEFLTSIPIRKTRAGLQFTCAAATLSEKRDVWVCNSDGYVGQVCIMSLYPEPNVTSCNGVCNARILCVASVPAYSAGNTSSIEHQRSPTQQHHSYTQQLRDYRKSISPNCTPIATMGGSSSSGGSSGSGEKKLATSDSNKNSDIQLDLNLSSSDDETDAAAAAAAAAAANERVPSPAPSATATISSGCLTTAGITVCHTHQDSNSEEGDGNQSTMWIGTEDGCIHVYNSTDNIRIKKNRIKIEHHSPVNSILYLDNRVFVSLANGDICVYLRDGAGGWNTSSSHCLSIGTVTSPVTKLINVHGKLWCSIQGIIKVLDIETLLVVNQIQISSDSKPITNMTVSNNYVWISIQNSAHIKCFHSNSHQLITEVNLAPAVNKMLSNCDEIIRQHKAACLRVTSLLSCKDLIWIGTSAGVLLTIPAQGCEKIGSSTSAATNIVPTGIPHGHTGHVRFLTFVETIASNTSAGLDSNSGVTPKDGSVEGGSNSCTVASGSEYKTSSSTKSSLKAKAESSNILIISGGDGYEDFRNSGANSLSEIAGREDSTNHLLIWQI